MHSILVIGCGSIGERHLRCFLNTRRCHVAACDTNSSLTAIMHGRYGQPAYNSLDEALSAASFDAAIICTPAHLHLPLANQLMQAGLDIFIEKPLSIDQQLVPETRQTIARTQRKVAVAYVYHLMPWLQAARDFLARGELGRIRHISSTSGQHFPTFRPAYRDIYYARHELGGGAIQDALTHVMNAVEWLIGPCTRVYCDAVHQVLEGVTVEDTVNLAARHGEVLASYTLTQFQAPNENTLLLNGELGSLKIEIHNRRWGILKHGDADWAWHVTPPMERDDLFTAQAHAFLDVMEGKHSPLCTFEEAVQTLRFNEAALRSSATQLPVVLE